MITTSPDVDVVRDILKLADNGLAALLNNEPEKFNDIAFDIELCASHSFSGLKQDLHSMIVDLSWDLSKSAYNSDNYVTTVRKWHEETVNVCKSHI